MLLLHLLLKGICPPSLHWGSKRKVFNPKPSKCGQGKLLPRYPGTYSGNPGVKSAVGECGRGGEKMEGNLYCRKWSWEVDLMAFSRAQLEIYKGKKDKFGNSL